MYVYMCVYVYTYIQYMLYIYDMQEHMHKVVVHILVCALESPCAAQDHVAVILLCMYVCMCVCMHACAYVPGVRA